MTANDDRVPAHYSASYIHWDLCHRVGMDYFSGNATKYISRWRKKGGRADLEKAQHYLAKLREISNPSVRRELPMSRAAVLNEVEHFARANQLVPFETHLVAEIATWQYVQELDAILGRMPEIIDKLDSDWRQAPSLQQLRLVSDPKPVPVEDSNKHADRATQDDPLGR